MESFNGKVWAGVDYTEGLWSQRSLMRKFKNKDVTLFKSNTIIQKVSIQECTNYKYIRILLKSSKSGVFQVFKKN